MCVCEGLFLLCLLFLLQLNNVFDVLEEIHVCDVVVGRSQVDVHRIRPFPSSFLRSSDEIIIRTPPSAPSSPVAFGRFFISPGSFPNAILFGDEILLLSFLDIS